MHKRARNPVPGPKISNSVDPGSTSTGGRTLPPWLAEIEERLRKRPSLWDTLSEENREFLRNYDGPEVLGPPPPPPMPRRPRRRGET